MAVDLFADGLPPTSLTVEAPRIIVLKSPQVAAAFIMSTSSFRMSVTPEPLSSNPSRQ